MASRPNPVPSDRYDWHAVYRSPEFARLADRRGRFVRARVRARTGLGAEPDAEPTAAGKV